MVTITGMETQKAIVVGGSSGIGRELGRVLAREGYIVGLTARRVELLAEIQREFPGRVFIKPMDVSRPEEAMKLLEELIVEMGGLDLLVINAAVGGLNPDLDWKTEQETIEINVTGFAAVANAGIKYFVKQGSGHLVDISSVAALRGNRQAPAYYASKAFVSNYAQGLRHKVGKLKLPITITDIQPGHVDTAMIKGEERLFWVAPVEKAASQIFQAIRRKRKHAYITHRWRLIAWAMKILPDFLYHKF